jgi:hypothetical protein
MALADATGRPFHKFKMLKMKKIGRDQGMKLTMLWCSHIAITLISRNVAFQSRAGDRPPSYSPKTRRVGSRRTSRSCRSYYARLDTRRLIMAHWWSRRRRTPMPQQLQLVIFVLAMAALVVCGCIFTRKPSKNYHEEPEGSSFRRTSARLFRS